MGHGTTEVRTVMDSAIPAPAPFHYHSYMVVIDHSKILSLIWDIETRFKNGFPVCEMFEIMGSEVDYARRRY